MAPTNSLHTTSAAASSPEQTPDKKQPTAADLIAFGGFPHPHALPTFTDPYRKREWMLNHMAGAFRVFSRKGFTEGAAGHISIRDPVDPTTFWINPLGVHFGLLTASDMVHVNELGQVLEDGNQHAVNTAGFRIHSALHKARPDVDAACHTHSTFGRAYSALSQPLDMLNQDVLLFYKHHSVYEGYGGVALESDEGEAIAQSLGPTNKAVILRNHGLLTVGKTVDEAAYLFTLMEKSCEIQLLVDSVAGGPNKVTKHIIPDKEAQWTFEHTSDPEGLYTEFQPDYAYEVKMSNGELVL